MLINPILNAQKIRKEKIDNYIKYIESHNLDIGSISIFKNGKEHYYQNFGKEFINEKSEIYQVGSITKLFTATLIFKLIEGNKISLETKLSSYFPDIKNADKITIKNLLEHSSGLSNYVKKAGATTWLTEPQTESEIFNELKIQKTLFLPNDSVSYSNSGYYLLGKIIEKEFNQPYGKSLKEYILTPIKLKQTESATEEPQNIANSYYFENGKWNLSKDFYFKNIIGVGDISSTPKDLNIFINTLLDEKIISKENLSVMKPIVGKEIYGRGLMTFKFHNIDFYGNTGGTYGTNSLVIYEPKSKISIALIINGEQYPRNEFMNDIVNIIFNNEIKYPENK